MQKVGQVSARAFSVLVVDRLDSWSNDLSALDRDDVLGQDLRAIMSPKPHALGRFAQQVIDYISDACCIVLGGSPVAADTFVE